MPNQTSSKIQRSQFLKWFQPILEALKQLDGSGKPREVSDKIAENLKAQVGGVWDVKAHSPGGIGLI